jgi:hypothetical protein
MRDREEEEERRGEERRKKGSKREERKRSEERERKGKKKESLLNPSKSRRRPRIFSRGRQEILRTPLALLQSPMDPSQLMFHSLSIESLPNYCSLVHFLPP